MTDPPPDHVRACAIAARTSGCTRFNDSASSQSPCVTGGKSPAVAHFNGQCGDGRQVEHHPASLVGTAVRDGACGEVSIHEVGEIPIEIRKTVGKILPQALKYSAHVLVEPRLDDLRGPLVFLFVSVPAL